MLKKYNELDQDIVKFVDKSGGIENIIGCLREEVYNEFLKYTGKTTEDISSNFFTRHLNLIYNTSVKLISYQCKMSYIFIKKEEEK